MVEESKQIDTTNSGFPLTGGFPVRQFAKQQSVDSSVSMNSALTDGIETLVPLIIKLQNAFSMIKARNLIELPQIVVVGAQSSGKSSVLESIVGRDFLPRGTGIVTRCPLILNLKRIEDKDKDGKEPPADEYAEFSHKEGQIFTNFDQVRQEIVNQTTKLAGGTKGITDSAISLVIYSKTVVDLTLVDLPGLTKVPVQGQPVDIENQIRNLVLKFVIPSNALILALSPATTDLANSDSLKLAREVDPQGDRTIGVITKIDLMDQGTDAVELLSGSIYPLKLGYFGAKCRSQLQIDQRLTIREAISNEAEFFNTHPVYSQQSSKMGIPYLTKSLNRILVGHIQRCIPDLSKQITLTIQQKERELLTYNTMHLAVDKNSMGPIILNLIARFTEEYGKKLEGRFVSDVATEMIGGARINFIFHKIFKNIITKIDPFENLTEQDIQTAIKNASAMSPSLFVPEGAFEVLVRQQIARLLEPSLDCAAFVYEELRRLVLEIQLPELQRYYKLQSRMHDVMESVLNDCLTPTNEMILNLVEIETSLINTNHPDFIGSADSLLNLFQEPDFIAKKNDAVATEDGAEGAQADNTDAGTGDDRAFSLLQQPEKSQDNDKAGSELLGSEKQKTGITSYLPNFFNRGNNQDSTKNPNGDNEPENRKETEAEKAAEDTKRRKEVASFGMKPQLDHFRPQNQRPTIDEHGNLPEVFLDEVPQMLRSHPQQESSRVIMETRVIQNLIFSYFTIVKKNIADLVPKTIMNFLVNESRRMAQSELVVKVYQDPELEKLLVEDPIVAANREACQQVIKALRSAQVLLSEVTQYRI